MTDPATRPVVTRYDVAPSQVEPGPARAKKPPVAYSARLARSICARVADGESVAAICETPGMPSDRAVSRWLRQYPRFAVLMEKARRAGGVLARSRQLSTYDPIVAAEILERISAGETLVAICRDPGLPAFSSVYRWRRTFPEFAAALKQAREVQAELICDLSYEMAMGMGPGESHAMAVKLTHLRWMTGVLSPRRFGRMRPVERDGASGDLTVIVRRFTDAVDPAIGRPLQPGEQYVVSGGPPVGPDDED